MASCGASHNNDIGTTLRSCDLASLNLFASTSAATMLLTIVMTWPMPMRCRCVGGLVGASFTQSGNTRRSNNGIVTQVPMSEHKWIEATGILKWELRRLSMVLPCMIMKLISTAIGIHSIKPLIHIGTILTSLFRSSTCCTVHNFHGFTIFELDSSSLFTAARFKNLQI